MSVSAVLGLIWIILISIVAMTPYPWHRNYALALLILFPVLLMFIARDFGAVWSLLFFGAAASIYRRPLVYYLMKLRQRWFGGKR